MTLPHVAGWVIDFRTAREIFSSGSNSRITHCVGLCNAGQMHICHCEERLFRDDLRLRAPFIDDGNCVLVPDERVAQRCIAISSNPLAARRIRGNEAAIFITALAAEKGLGVISNHRSLTFTTVFDLCSALGVPIFSANDYFAAL